MAGLVQMKKSKLIEELTKHYSSDVIEDFLKNKPNRQELIMFIKEKLDEESDESQVHSESSEVPLMTDPSWTKYVLDLLQDNEKCDGNPTVNGLRRVAQLVKNKIKGTRSTVEQCPTKENGQRSVVVVTVHFEDGSFFDGVAETNRRNTPEEYICHSVATAESRAEGRALRKALCLNTYTSEEMVKADPVTDEDKVITDGQRNSIVTMATKLDVDVSSIMEQLEIKKESLADLTSDEAIKMMGTLKIMQNMPTK